MKKQSGTKNHNATDPSIGSVARSSIVPSPFGKVSRASDVQTFFLARLRFRYSHCSFRRRHGNYQANWLVQEKISRTYSGMDWEWPGRDVEPNFNAAATEILLPLMMFWADGAIPSPRPNYFDP